MKPDDLKKWIVSLSQDIDFTYKGWECTINPFTLTDISMSVNGDNQDYTHIDDLMTDKRFQGKSLSEISDQCKFS